MYCTKCGKEIESGSICTACAVNPPVNPIPPVNQQPPQYQYQQNYSQHGYSGNNPEPQQPLYSNQPDPRNRMYGFGKALTSTIMSNIGLSVAYLALGFVATEYHAFLGFMFFLFALPLTVIPFILGLQSIKTFNRRKAPCVRPVATLVLGIVGVAISAFALFFELFAFLMFFVVI